MSREIEITAETLTQLLPSKHPNDITHPVKSLSFSTNGERIIMSTEDDSIFMYDMNTAMKSRCINSKKYGCSHVRFASDAMCALHGSTKIDNTIRYLSLTDNKYIRYFQGHDGLVTGINVSPLDDMFLSVAKDRSIRLWDLRTYNCIGLMTVAATPIATFDPEGLLFAAGIDNNTVKLYDLRSFDKGPFSSFECIRNEDDLEWTMMRFSPCGKYILICTNGNQLTLLDAFTGSLLYTLQEHQNSEKVPLNASFTPESSHIMVGSSDGFIYFYSVESGEVVHRLRSPKDKTCHYAEFSPNHFAAATSTTTEHLLTLWCASDELKNSVQL